MSNLTPQQTNISTNVPPLRNPPCSPFCSGNAVNNNAATNVGTVVIQELAAVHLEVEKAGLVRVDLAVLVVLVVITKVNSM